MLPKYLKDSTFSSYPDITTYYECKNLSKVLHQFTYSISGLETYRRNQECV